MPVIIIGIILVAYGFYGLVKRKIFNISALGAGRRYQMEAAKNIPFGQKAQQKNYFVFGTWAIIQGVILMVLGVIIVIIGLNK